MAHVVSMDRARLLVHKLFERYLEVGQQANLTRGTLADLAGVNRSTFYSLAKKYERGETVELTAHMLLRLKALLPAMQEDFEKGTLPVGSRSTKSQGHYVRLVLPTESDD